MQDGMPFPLGLQPRDGQAVEEFAFPLEVGMQRGNQQAFPEAARTGQEVITAGRSKTIDELRLVHIQIAVVADFLEVLDADGQILKYHIPYVLFCLIAEVQPVLCKYSGYLRNCDTSDRQKTCRHALPHSRIYFARFHPKV